MGDKMSEKELKIETEKQPSLVSICIITKNEKENLLSEDGKDYTICAEPRVFSKNYYHYEGAIYEQVVPLSNEMSKREYYHSGMYFIHTGYIGTNEDLWSTQNNMKWHILFCR